MKIVEIITDFTGKKLGSLTENGHVARNTYYTDTGNIDTKGSLIAPYSMGELKYQWQYDYLLPTNSSSILSYGDDNTRSQFIASLDLIWAVEQYYGASVWGGAVTIAEKREKLKTFFLACDCTIKASGYTNNSGSLVYKRYMSVFSNITGAWHTTPNSTTASGSVDLVRGIANITFDEYVDNSGRVHFITYTDLDTNINATYNSVMSVDYVKLALRVDEDMMLPSAPTGLTATSEVGAVSLAWNLNAQATSYKVLRSTVSGGTYTTIATVTGTSYEDVMSNQLDTTTYYYKIVAVNNIGDSPSSSEVAATPIPLYTEVNVFIHPSKWGIDGTLPLSIRQDIVSKHNEPGKRQEINSQPPIFSIRTYNY